MTLEELKEFIKDNKDAFAGLVKEMGFETADDVAGLKLKNNELLGKAKKLKEESEKLQKIVDEVDIDEYIELKEKASKGGKGGDEVAQLKKQMLRLETERDKEKSEREAESLYLEKTLKSTAISEALDSNNFDPKHKDILKSAYSGKARVEKEDDKRTVVIEDNDGIPLTVNEYFKKFATTDNGKSYLREPENKGAHSKEMSRGNGSGKVITRTDFDALSAVEKMQYGKDNPGYTVTD